LGGVGWGNGGKVLVDAKGELHSFEGARFSALTRMTELLFLFRALADEVGGGVVLEVGCLEFFDAPFFFKIEGRKETGGEKERGGEEKRL
jgi:hypothetical protein